MKPQPCNWHEIKFEEFVLLSFTPSAVEQGLVEYIGDACPVLCSHYGKNESGYKTNTATADNAIAAYQDIEPTPEIIPLLRFSLYNGNSTDNRLPASAEGAATQLQVLSRLGIGRVIFRNAGSRLPDSGDAAKAWLSSLEALRPRSLVAE